MLNSANLRTLRADETVQRMARDLRASDTKHSEVAYDDGTPLMHYMLECAHEYREERSGAVSADQIEIATVVIELAFAGQ